MDIQNEQLLKKAIMRRIYLAYVVRRIFHAVTLKSAALVLFLWGIFVQVSVSNVFINAKTSVSTKSFYGFFESAFINTELLVQIFVMGILVMTLWLGYDLYQTVNGTDNKRMIIAR